jgi:hypothetical protein
LVEIGRFKAQTTSVYAKCSNPLTLPPQTCGVVNVDIWAISMVQTEFETSE